MVIIYGLLNHQSQPSATISASCSRNFWSSSSKPEGSVQSISIMATVYPISLASASNTRHSIRRILTSPLTRIGTTISLRLSASHAICPGNSSTSGTMRVFWLAAAVPHTPFPYRICWQAGLPWNGPSSRSCSSGDEYVVEIVTPPMLGTPGRGGDETGEARAGNLSSRM